MDRMVAQGLLTTQENPQPVPLPRRDHPEQARRGEALHTLETAFNGALTPMVQCLLDTSDLTGKDLAELEALIREKRKNKTP